MRFLLLLFAPFVAFCFEFKVATYNVENLFDAHYDGSEYQEYIPNTKHHWNEAMLHHKIVNLARVIRDMNADIIALEEVENEKVLLLLNKELGEKAYPYHFFPLKKERISVESAVLSRFPIAQTNTMLIKNQPRGIHRIVITIEKKPLVLFLNHWPAQKERVEERMAYALALNSMLRLESKSEYIVLGDFNSPYQIQKDDWGTALVRLLQTGDKDALHYNLWYELPEDKRFSHVYGKHKEALDHLLIPRTLSDTHDIEYKAHSFEVFKRSYMLDEKGNPIRWQISDRGKGEHLGFGFSDHLPITAIFQIITH